eukprot:TRINITY_DN2008_c0_g1_i51.p1 TRINITY_DN2008_c0_g1~~TRINITY_DN2008_c0_g1_i51.p1  ORF type:complete len:132 (+),score=7.01 TRINITY_DN2008_c0_g1_i51:318-713(+)
MHSNPLPPRKPQWRLGILDQLVHLDMHSNPSLSGTIPDNRTRQPRKPRVAPYPTASEASAKACALTVARAHVMHSNPLLSGTVPDSLGSLSQLVYLDMHSNPSLSGTIPDKWLPRNPRSACAPRHAQQPLR